MTRSRNKQGHCGMLVAFAPAAVFLLNSLCHGQAQYLASTPDWNQPTLVGAPGGNTGDWRAWCVPSATANILGFYRDAGVAGIADATAFPTTGLWGAPDFQDECADGGYGPMHAGYYLDTNGNGLGGAMSHDGTRLVDIKTGLEQYFAAHSFPATYVRNYGSHDPAHLPPSLYCAFDTTLQPQGVHSDAGAWAVIQREIDAGRPLLGHFTHGNMILTSPPDPTAIPGAEDYRLGSWDDLGNPNGDDLTGEVWDVDGGLGHTMTIVGYWPMPNPHGQDLILVFDNRDIPFNNDPNLSQRLPIAIPWAGAPWAGLTSVAPSNVIYVDADNANPGADGLSWGTAYPDLQSALVDAAVSWLPCDIWVADGLYRPAAPAGNRLDTFQLLSAVGVYGGFNGTETSRDQRDPVVHATILSGDLNSDDGTTGTSENSYHVVTGSGADMSAVLSGFTITAGNSDNPSGHENRGAAMFNITSGGPTVEGCTFIDNHSISHGGAMYNRDAAPTVVNCRFLGNTTGNVGGGAVYNWRSATLYINCAFSGNTATGGNGGGAMRSEDTPNPSLVNCSFTLNQAVSTAYYGGGGGLAVMSSQPAIVNSIFWANSDDTGSGEDAQIFRHAPGDTVTIEFSCVQSWSGAMGGSNNFGSDPLFVDADGADNTAGTADDDLRLKAASPCINAGDNGSAPCGTDLDGGDRIVDGTVEMGAYEHTPVVTLAEGFESGSLAGWHFWDSTNGQQSGSACPGTWDSGVTGAAINGLFSARLFAEATSSCVPWRLDAAISRNVGAASRLSATLRFDDIQGKEGAGHSFFQITAFNAEDPGQAYSYGFSTTGDLAGDALFTVSPGDTVSFSADIAADYFAKYGSSFPGEVIIRFRSSADYNEAGSAGNKVRTTDVVVDDVEVVGDVLDCPADINRDGNVNVLDLLAMLTDWGACSSPCATDLDKDGNVNVVDLLLMLQAWGPCGGGGGSAS